MRIDEKKLFIQLAKKNWNICNLADTLGVCPQTIEAIKKRKSPRPSTIGKIAKALDCEPEDLLEME